VVIGGSIAGLLAARVLQDHFDTVTILERDRLPGTPGRRAGAPQAAHQHVLLLRGLRILEAQFPGLTAELVGHGAPVVDMAREVAWLTPAGWGVRFPSDLGMLTCSRDLLESTIRERLRRRRGVSLSESTEVCGLIHDHGRVHGVRRRTPGLGSVSRDDHADLVVDASGRHSKLPDWLAALGYDRPQEEVVNGHLGYASRTYRLPHPERLGWRGAYVQPAPPNDRRGGVLFPLEGGRWLLTLAGMGGDHPPTHESGFLAFAESLRSPILFDAIRGAEPLTPIAGFRATENRRRRYEALARWPEGLMVLGDAACTFNPVYAQGMTTAALTAEALQAAFGRTQRGNGARVPIGMARSVQRRLARINAAPWRLATSEDLRLPQTTGARATLGVRLLHAYFDRIARLTTARPDVRLTFLRVMHMLDTPAALFAPRVLAAALRAGGGGA
jgi:2-polyprenyl-6-methoxyphenol hydroxylase-like FAD-dependent oxidoreductase